jgi:predicted small lipoprotein YifL
MRIARALIAPTLAAALLAAAGCGEKPLDPASVQTNEAEQKLLQQGVQKGITKAPATKPARRR